MGGGIGKAEAAGVGGDAHIHRLRHILVHGQTQDGQHIPHKLRAGSAGAVHQFLRRVGSTGAVMVDLQRHTVRHRRKSPGQHILSRHIHSHYGIRGMGQLLGQTLQQEIAAARAFRRQQDMGSLAQCPQTSAQHRGGTQGIPIGPLVGKNTVGVMGQQKPCRLSSRQILHRASLPGS